MLHVCNVDTVQWFLRKIKNDCIILKELLRSIEDLIVANAVLLAQCVAKPVNPQNCSKLLSF